MSLSILHVSDLHRDPMNPIGNEVLLSSLRRDRDRYTSSEDPHIQAPNFIIVSGDVVQGVKHGTADAEGVLKRQYEEATAFLNALTEDFVDGDKDRIVIVPGNHDVSDDVFRKSVKRIDVEPNARRAIVSQLFHPDSNLRWSWEDLAIYEITNRTVYNDRLAAFAEFYGAFYDRARSYTINPAGQIDVFNYPDFGIAVVGFSSCHNNDLFNRQGAVHPDCIAEADNWFRDTSLAREPIRIAVWHHNTEGPPSNSDYLDPDVVQNLIDRGFSLGFHGHRHKPECLNTKFRHGPDRRMMIISAGTLCGGAAFRHGRAYNIVEIDAAARTGCLHLREMQNDNFQMPIWGPRGLPPNRPSHVNFTFDAPPRPFVRFDRSTVLLNEAVTLYDTGELRLAADKLAPLATAEPLARRLLLECYLQLDDAPAVIATFDPPESSAEAIALMDALWRQRLRPRLREVIRLPMVARSEDNAVIEIRDKYAVRVKS